MYRKFNNTYKKVSVTDLLGDNQNKNTPSYKEYLKKVNQLNLEMGVKSPTFIEFEGIKYTFGVELETVGGSIKKADSDLLNLKTDFDGSLRGPDGEDPTGAEYVTGVLVGDTGLRQLYNICKTLSRECELDYRCGVHIHIGGLKWSKEDVVYCYLLALILENQIFNTLPNSRRHNAYCRNLTRVFEVENVLSSLKETKDVGETTYNIFIEKVFNKIFLEVSGGIIEGRGCNKNTNHPKGPKCGFNKSSQRYCWLNFVPLLFNTKEIPDSYTLEIRNHGASLNYNKIKNWIKLWFAFCNYIDNHKEDILLMGEMNSLTNVINTVYPKRGKNLVDYITKRTQLFSIKGEEVDYEAEEHSKNKFKEILEV